MKIFQSLRPVRRLVCAGGGLVLFLFTSAVAESQATDGPPPPVDERTSPAAASPPSFGVRVGGGFSIHEAGQGIAALGASIPFGEVIRVQPDLALGMGSKYQSQTAAVSLLIHPFALAGFDPYAGGGVGVYRETSDESGSTVTRSAMGIIATAGVQRSFGAVGAFLEARSIGIQYEGDESITQISMSLPQITFGLSLSPFAR